MKALEALARLCAILAGVLMVFITMMTVVSIIGRELFGAPIVGDFELSGAVAGAAIALFMPWCQVKRGNIMVDFFTAKASESAQNIMDRLGAVLLGCVMALMAWRTSVGGLNSFRTNSETQILGFPEWVIYAVMVPPLALTVLIAMHQGLFGFAEPSTEDNPELAV